MSQETAYFHSQDGLRLYYRSWLSEHPKQVLCIIHGLGEHSGRYVRFANYLAAKGVSVFAMDLRGHGLSQGKRGHTPNYELLLSDIEELLKHARATYTELPMFLLGQSMGGNLVANYMIAMNTNEVAGFILISPWFQLAFTPPRWKQKLTKIVVKILPGFSQPSGLNSRDLSHDPEIIKAYDSDPLVHRQISVKLFDEATKAGNRALEKGKVIDTPGLVVHSQSDPITDWKSSESFVKKNSNMTFLSLHEQLHEPINDVDKEELDIKIHKWIVEHQVTSLSK